MQAVIYGILGDILHRGLWVWAIAGFLVGGIAEGVVYSRLQAAVSRNKR